MPRKISKRLVIDISVAVLASGGRDTVHPNSKNCRDFLAAVLRISHRVVMTPAIEEEWKRHPSRFITIWRREMTRKGKIHTIQEVEELLRDELMALEFTEPEQQAVLKDCILIDAAIATDRTVISLDETARDLFSKACVSIKELKSIVWVNPDKTQEEPILWLKAGARSELKRRLGSRI